MEPKLAYVVTAYRYGMRDEHSYFVSVSTNLDEAKASAESEVEYPGGKYGCEVVECPIGPWSEELKPVQVFYAPGFLDGMLGSGMQTVDRCNDGWKERHLEAMREGYKMRMGRRKTTPSSSNEPDIQAP